MTGGAAPRTASRLPAPFAVAAALALVLGLAGRGGAARAADPAPAPVSPPWPPALAGVLTDEQRGELAFLEHLGWRFVPQEGIERVTPAGGRPCAHATLAEAQEAGDLRLLVPPALTDAEARRFAASIPDVAASAPSRCAYLHRIRTAVRAATARLGEASERGYLRFPMLLFWHSPFFAFRPPGGAWAQEGRIWHASPSPAGAISAVYERGGMAECFSAQQLAVFATQYELYGPADFDLAFAPKDVTVGRPADQFHTPVGQYTRPDMSYPWAALLVEPEEQALDPGKALARHGPVAFSGLTGALRGQGEGDVAIQNCTIVSVSERATEALAAGGFAAIVPLGTKAYAALDEARGFFTSAATTKAKTAELEAILAHPLFSEVVVYCHPFGVVPLATVAKKDMEDHDVAVAFELYFDGREDALYQRYRGFWEQRWLAAHPAPPASPAK